jgi:SAM-dependent methyltransferase
MHAMQHATLLLVLTSKTHALSADPSKGFAIFARNVMRGNQRCFSRVADDLAQRGLPNGARVLDLGASAGEPSLTIASRGFRVVSTDFAPPNKALGATRAAAFGLSDRVEFHTADAQDLSRWGDGTFDACVGTYVLMFTPDVERVCREVRRVLKPGAPFITTVWQPPARVDMFGAGLMKTVLALREAGQLPKPDPANPPANPCNLADSVPGALGDALANAGFGRVAAEEWSYPIVIACVEINQCGGCPDNSSLSHFSAMTRPSWLGRAVRNEHQDAIEQASRRHAP